MKISVSDFNGRNIGKIKAEVMMRTPKGLIRKVNSTSCYAGDNSDEPTWNEKFSQGDLNVPIWYLTDEQAHKIEFDNDLTLETISPIDKAIMSLTQDDVHTAVLAITALTDFHCEHARREHKRAKDTGAEQEAVFDNFGRMDSLATLLAIEKMVN
jgi:hypothetical protein